MDGLSEFWVFIDGALAVLRGTQGDLAFPANMDVCDYHPVGLVDDQVRFI